MNKNIALVLIVVAGLSLLITPSVYAGSNFSIVPMAGTTPPTEVLLGSTVNAYYTITNLTSTTRMNYKVVGVSSSVTQATTDEIIENLCPNPINLAAKASCNLKLIINGAVNGSFAICNGSNCTTPIPPLHVALNNKSCDPILGPMTLINDIQETVYNYITDGCGTEPGNYSDVPVRPFIVGNDGAILWFASNSQGYFKTNGVPVGPGVPDKLAQMVRATTTGNQCVVWLESHGQGGNITTYNNELWMVSPYTPDGQNIFALIHNEYHPIPVNVENEYGNLVAANSTDGGSTFQLVQNASNFNTPVIVAPYAYQNIYDNNHETGIAGMFAQSNIIKWGNYYYVLVEQFLSILNADAPAPGVCIYRTQDLTDPRSWLGFNGTEYNVPLVPRYPDTLLTDPSQYFCHTVLPQYYRFSWSYNVVLNKFIIIGLDTAYTLSTGSSVNAFVYTLANLDPVTGILSSATNTSGDYKEYFLREITWFEEWAAGSTVFGQSYPSVLDPASPEISNHFGPGLIANDRNFQYSGSNPYIYYTLLFPFNQNQGQDRNVAREALSVKNCIP